jgi:predicted dehydrogenase
VQEFQAAVIGAGGFARDIAAHAGKFKHLRLSGAYDTDAAAAASFVASFGGRVYHSLDEVLADKSIEGVLVVTPNDVHRPLVEAAARAGKHVFVEKPIANTVADARAAIKAASDAGVTLFVGHLARRATPMRMAKKMIESGEFGKLILIEGHTAHNGGLFLQPAEWRWRRERCPGGPLIQLAVHTVDTFNYLFGPVKSVSAKSTRLATPAEIDDVGVISLEYANGALGSIGTAYVVPGSGFTNIYGTEASLLLDSSHRDFLVRHKDGRVETRSAITSAEPIVEEMDEFALVSRAGARPETGGEEGLQALAVILAAVKSAAEGRSVTIEEILRG